MKTVNIQKLNMEDLADELISSSSKRTLKLNTQHDQQAHTDRFNER